MKKKSVFTVLASIIFAATSIALFLLYPSLNAKYSLLFVPNGFEGFSKQVLERIPEILGKMFNPAGQFYLSHYLFYAGLFFIVAFDAIHITFAIRSKKWTSIIMIALFDLVMIYIFLAMIISFYPHLLSYSYEKDGTMVEVNYPDNGGVFAFYKAVLDVNGLDGLSFVLLFAPYLALILALIMLLFAEVSNLTYLFNNPAKTKEKYKIFLDEIKEEEEVDDDVIEDSRDILYASLHKKAPYIGEDSKEKKPVLVQYINGDRIETLYEDGSKVVAKQSLDKEDIRRIIREELAKLNLEEKEEIVEKIENKISKDEKEEEAKPKKVVGVINPSLPPHEKIIKIPFPNRINDGDDKLKEDYNELKAEILSYGCNSRVSNVGESFRLHAVTYVKLNVAGKGLKLYLALDPKDYKDSTYPIGDVSSKKIYKDIPLTFKVKSPLSMKRAKILIADAMKKGGLSQGRIIKKDYASELKDYKPVGSKE